MVNRPFSMRQLRLSGNVVLTMQLLGNWMAMDEDERNKLSALVDAFQAIEVLINSKLPKDLGFIGFDDIPEQP